MIQTGVPTGARNPGFAPAHSLLRSTALYTLATFTPRSLPTAWPVNGVIVDVRLQNMTGPANIDDLLQQPSSAAVAQQLVDWANAAHNQIARGDMMLGIISVDDAAKIPTAYERAAEFGISAAWLQLAWWHAMPGFGEQNIAAAESAIETAIAEGVEDATLDLVKLRWFFMREVASEDKRIHTYQLAQRLAEQSHGADALYFLALLTTHGFGTSASPEVGFNLQEQAADLGSADAMFELYIHHENGLGTTADHKLAFAACKRAAEAGYHRAMYNLGAFNATGRGTPKDMKKAVEWYERAADVGNPSAMAGLAAIYATGDGVEVDREYAEQLFDQADYCGLDVSGLRAQVGL